MAAATERRLVAILAADVVGYSRLMEADEAATLASIRALRSDVIDPIIAEHHGRIIKLMGDGAIVEFGSVVDAVSAAVAVQNRTTEHEKKVAPTRRIVFRIGINLGDVVVEGDDLFGDGVNVAARLEQLCRPGGVMISGTAYDHMQGKLGLPLDFAGHQHVKNISRPIRSYQVRMAGTVPGWRLRFVHTVRRWRLPVAAAALVGLVAVGGGVYYRHQVAPTVPTVAVLPFKNLSGTSELDRLTDGIFEDVVTDLSHSTALTVIASSSTEGLRGKQIDPRQVGRDLGVSYLLGATLQAGGDRLTTTAKLIEAASGKQVWSQRWNTSSKDVFAVQGDMAEKVVAALVGYEGAISAAERKLTIRKPPATLSAYDSYLLGMEAKHKLTAEGFTEAENLFKKAIEQDPQFARAYVGLTYVYSYQAGDATGPQADAYNEKMMTVARRAIELDPGDAESHIALAVAFNSRGQNDLAVPEYDRAESLAPGNADILMLISGGLPNEQIERAAKLADRALILNPYYPDWYNPLLINTYFWAKQYEKAVKYGISRNIAFPYLRAFLALSYAKLDDKEHSNQEISDLLKSNPSWTLESSPFFSFSPPVYLDEYLPVAQRAGLPVCIAADNPGLAQAHKMAYCEKVRAQSKRT